MGGGGLIDLRGYGDGQGLIANQRPVAGTAAPHGPPGGELGTSPGRSDAVLDGAPTITESVGQTDADVVSTFAVPVLSATPTLVRAGALAPLR